MTLALTSVAALLCWLRFGLVTSLTVVNAGPGPAGSAKNAWLRPTADSSADIEFAYGNTESRQTRHVDTYLMAGYSNTVDVWMSDGEVRTVRAR